MGYDRNMSAAATHAWGELGGQATAVTSAEGLAQVAAALYAFFGEYGQEWENSTLESYLEALSACLEADKDSPLDWAYFARNLVLASNYE
jgi:hypothetical protein